MTEPKTYTLDAPGAVLHYDVRSNDASAQPVLLLIGSPMGASGFVTLSGHFTDRTVVTYDPRGAERSKRTDGALRNTTEEHADDLHRLISALDTGPVDIFGSSGGAINGLALVACGVLAVYPDSVAAAHTVLVEPWLVLCCLAGWLAVFDGDRITASTRRLAWGGAAFGVAGAVESWAILPVLVLLVLARGSDPPGTPRGADGAWPASRQAPSRVLAWGSTPPPPGASPRTHGPGTPGGLRPCWSGRRSPEWGFRPRRCAAAAARPRRAGRWPSARTAPGPAAGRPPGRNRRPGR